MSGTIADFIRRHDALRIAVSSARRVTRANAPADWDGWEHDAYRTRITFAGKQLDTPYRKGLGHHGNPPTLEEVLSAYASDDPRGEPFEEWAPTHGFDVDSIKALRIYETCVKSAAKARAFFGDDVYAELLDCESL